MGDLFTVLGWLGVMQAVLVASAVLTHRGESHPAVPVLGAMLLAGAGALSAILLSHQAGPHWLLWATETACTVASGPLVYAWVARVLEDNRRGRLRRHLWIPAALVVFELCSVTNSRIGLVRSLPHLPLGGLLLFQASYTTAAAALLARRWREPEAIARRGWLALIVSLFALVHAASFVRLLGGADPLFRDLVPAAALLVIYAVSFVAMRQPRLLRLVDDFPVEPSPLGGQSAPGDATPFPSARRAYGDSDAGAAPDGGSGAGAPARRRYETSPLRNEQVAALRERLLAYLAAERPYLRPDLALPDLARELDTLPTHLSRVVNESGEGFPELLARYRVEEAKGLLADPALDHLTVEALGRRAGFRSRSAFHEAFRRRVGTTPSAYRRERART